MNLTEYINKNHKSIITKPFANYTKHNLCNDVALTDLNFLCETLCKFGINYNILFGTLLGLYRECKLIEHDCDIDVAIRFSDSVKLIKCIDVLKDNGFKLTRYSRDMLLSVYRNNVYIDIYLFKESGNNMSCSIYNISKKDFDGENYIECGDFKFKTILNIVPFFEKYYGKDWETPVRGVSAHPKHSTRKKKNG